MKRGINRVSSLEDAKVKQNKHANNVRAYMDNNKIKLTGNIFSLIIVRY